MWTNDNDNFNAVQDILYIRYLQVVIEAGVLFRVTLSVMLSLIWRDANLSNGSRNVFSWSALVDTGKWFVQPFNKRTHARFVCPN